MKITKGFEEAMQEMIQYVKHQDLNVKRQFQKELEAVNEFLEEVLVSFEHEDQTPAKPTKNQERKKVIEEAKRYWKEKGKGFFLAHEVVDDDIVYRLGFKPNNQSISTFLGHRNTLPEIPNEYQTNIYLMRAFLLSDTLGDDKYPKQKALPLPTHLETNMEIKTSDLPVSTVVIKQSAGKEFKPHYTLMDDTDVVYE